MLLSVALQKTFPKVLAKRTTYSRTAIAGDEKMKKVLVLIVLVLVFFGCIQNTPKQDAVNQEENNSEEEKENNTGGINLGETVEKGDSIKVEYVGKFPDTKEVFDKSEGRSPLEFEVGAGQMIKGFDKAVVGMKLTEEKTVVISPEDAYGPADSGQKVEVPIAQIQGEEEVKVGSTLFAANGQQGTVIEIKGDLTVIEFKHPMAGKSLEFWIKVVEINKA